MHYKDYGTLQLVDARGIGLRSGADGAIRARTLGCLGLDAA